MSLAMEHPQKDRLSAKAPGRHRFAMCSVEHFNVSYTINPWMRPGKWAQESEDLYREAQSEWKGLCGKIRELGGEIEILAHQDGVPDMVFMANAGVMLDGTVVPARFRFPERQLEEPILLAFFEVLKAQGKIDNIVELPAGIYHEGEGDAVWDSHRGLYWSGFGPRSSQEAAPFLSEVFGVPAVSLELVTEAFYHTDACLSALSGGEVIYYPPAFSESSRKRLLDAIGSPELAIDASLEDAENFSCNCINMGRDIIMMQSSAALREQLEGRGYRIHELPLMAFKLSGGSAFCLKMAMHNRSGNNRSG